MNDLQVRRTSNPTFRPPRKRDPLEILVLQGLKSMSSGLNLEQHRQQYDCVGYRRITAVYDVVWRDTNQTPD